MTRFRFHGYVLSHTSTDSCRNRQATHYQRLAGCSTPKLIESCHKISARRVKNQIYLSFSEPQPNLSKISANRVKYKMKSSWFSFLFRRCSLIYQKLVQGEWKMRLSESKQELALCLPSVSILSKNQIYLSFSEPQPNPKTTKFSDD